MSPASHADLVQAATASTMQLCRAMLNVLPPEAVGKLQALRDLGWWVGVEVSAGHDGEGRICLTAVSPAGERELFASISGDAPAIVH